MRSLGWLLLCGLISGFPMVAVAANFVAAPLSGSSEVPANGSKAKGNATFQLSSDGTQL